MAISNIKATFSSDIEKVWNMVTSLTDYAWRSDLSKIEVLEDGKRFAEYTKDGYSTEFTITAYEPCKKYGFTMENQNMSGDWSGIFSYQNGETTIDFTEDVTVKKVVMKPFVGMYLKKQQASYVSDLRKALEK